MIQRISLPRRPDHSYLAPLVVPVAISHPFTILGVQRWQAGELFWPRYDVALLVNASGPLRIVRFAVFTIEHEPPADAAYVGYAVLPIGRTLDVPYFVYQLPDENVHDSPDR